jgi:predicted GNAT family acetyltransferase
MDIDTGALAVVDNAAARRFEVHAGGEVAFLDYRREGATIAYIHTKVPAALEGHGIAAKLASHALAYARSNGLQVVPICPYVARYIEQHPEFRDLVAPRSAWRAFRAEPRAE